MIKGKVMFGTERWMNVPGSDSNTTGSYLEQPIFFGITGSMLFLSGTFLIGIYYITVSMRLREQEITHQKSEPKILGRLFLIIGLWLMYKGYSMFDTREWTVIADYFNLEQSLFFAITGSMVFLSGSLLTGMHYINSAISRKSLYD